jgi:hypothetical protein
MFKGAGTTRQAEESLIVIMTVFVASRVLHGVVIRSIMRFPWGFTDLRGYLPRDSVQEHSLKPMETPYASNPGTGRETVADW